MVVVTLGPDRRTLGLLASILSLFIETEGLQTRARTKRSFSVVCFKQNCSISEKLSRVFLGDNARILLVMTVWLCTCMCILLSVILFTEKGVKYCLVPSPNSYSLDGVVESCYQNSPWKRIRAEEQDPGALLSGSAIQRPLS